MREGLSRDRPADPANLFAHVYATPTPQLVAQAAMVADELAREQPVGED
jgi:2-oxoisovalerate dehydrogenase E1 component alpha subunit